MARPVGIDLGTTYSAIAVVGAIGKPEIIHNQEGDATTPSVVLFGTDETVVGKAAKQLGVADASHVVSLAKRYIGDPDYRYLIDDREYRPEYVSACVLKKLIEDARAATGEDFDQAVITVPAYFGDSERRATAEAAHVAGIEVIAIVDEPTAAALSYGLDKMDRNETLLVYDLGGGTFDVTVMRIAGGKLEVLATDGNRTLGGEDFDAAIATYVAEQVKQEHGIDLKADLDLVQDLMNKAEEQKKALSAKDSVTFAFRIDGKSIRVPLTRETLNSLIQDQLARTEILLEDVIKTAGLTWDQVDRVLLVGGSTRMPAVAELVKRVTGRDPIREVHPDQAVALGAAIRAASLSMSKLERRELGIPAPEDVIERIAHPLGIDVLNDARELVIDHILEAQTKKGEEVTKGPYTTNHDYQDRAEISVYEGAGKIPRECRLLGEAVLDMSPPRLAGEPAIYVTFKYNQSGVIEATAVDQDTDRRVRVEIRPTVGVDERQVREEARQLQAMRLA